VSDKEVLFPLTSCSISTDDSTGPADQKTAQHFGVTYFFWIASCLNQKGKEENKDKKSQKTSATDG